MIEIGLKSVISLVEDTMSIILSALESLAQICDGAVAKDSIGYNATDTHTAKHILKLKTITPDIEWLAWDILRKYKDQLTTLGYDYDSFPEPEAQEHEKTTIKEAVKKEYHILTSEERAEREYQKAIQEHQKAITEFNLSITSDNKIRCKFPYDAKLVAAIKEVPHARYDGQDPSWLIPIQTKSLTGLKNMLENLKIVIPTAILDLLTNKEKFEVVNTAILVNNRVQFNFEYDQELISLIKTSLEGARWNPESKVWTAPIAPYSIEGIKKVIRIGKFKTTSEVDNSINQYDEKIKTNYTDSLKQESDLEVNGLNGTLRPFQKAGVEYMTKNTSTLCADEQGLGKTIETLAAIEHNNAYPAIIVCPNSLKPNWKQEINKWLPHRKVAIFESTPITDTDFIILNYEKLKKFKIETKTTVVFDESHRVKNYKAQCTQHAKNLANGAKFKYLLSGTPMLNRPKELISQLEILGKLDEMGGFWKFANTYCNAKQTKYGLDINGASNLIELKNNLRKICLIRREKADVLPELPDKQRSILPFVITNRTDYKKAENDFLKFVEQNVRNDEAFKKELFQKNLSQEEIQQAISDRAQSAARKAERAEQLTKITALRKLAALGKLEAATEWLLDFAETGKKLVLFVHHIEILHTLKANLVKNEIKVVTLCGEDKPDDRQKAITEFQTNPNCQFIICSLKAGGEGITLTAAADVAFFEVGWKPAELDQAEDRCHRIGQKNAVNCYYFKSENTIEDYIYALIEKKRDITNIDKKSSIMQEVISSLQGKK